jgi:endonuclease/exonuclease/phosphatase (EEP) superfamily protein YafD
VRVVVVALLLCACSTQPAADLRLATYNLNFGNPDVARTLDALASTNADIALLQEITPAWESALRTRFASHYAHLSFHVPADGRAGHAVLSRFPLAIDTLLSKPDGAFYHGQRLVVTTPGGPLQILHIHLRASIDDDCFRGPCSQMHWVKGQFTTPPIRRREIEAHWKHVDRSLPTIVAGDFNESETDQVVAFLTRAGLARVPTTGPRTWHHGDLLSADIDHVMIDKRITPVGAVVLDAGASDHRPVVATLRLR